MDKSFLDMLKAASCLNKMKNTKLDKQTANRLRDLIYKDDTEINPEEEQENRETSAPERMADAQMNDQVEVLEERGDEEALPDYDIGGNENENGSGFSVNSEFLKKLERGEIRVESLTLPSLGKAIDGIALPKLPPIKALEGLIGNCSTPFEKQLTKTDLDERQGKLTLCKQAVEVFLKPMLKKGRENLKEGIEVTVYDEKGTGFRMSFKFWSDKFYVLAMGWNKFSSENELKKCEDFVTVWMFRHKQTDELCFAIIPRRFPITIRLVKPQKRGNQ